MSSPPPLRTRRLGPDDVSAVDAFLASRPTTTLFLRSNLRRAGLGPDQGQTCQGTWVGALRGDALVGVASLAWNGNLIFEAPDGLAPLLVAACTWSERSLTGLIGPGEQIDAAERALGLTVRPAQLRSREWLYALELDALRLPPALADGTLLGRLPHDGDELARLVEWRIDYMSETLGLEPTPQSRARARESVEWVQAERDHVVVVAAEAPHEPLAYSAFNARVPDCVQVGGVWTPPALRGRGYARAAVAASLLEARERDGVERAVLFTDRDNVPAQRAYEALGFARCGEYAIYLYG